MVSQTNLSAFKAWTIVTSVETDLKGLVYWWERHQEVPRTLEDSARGLWHLTALVNHADILFTGDRATDPQSGAVFRAFRDLGVPELGAPLQEALDLPATVNGNSLRALIKRMRNSFAHRSYDIDHHGDDIAFWGLGSSQQSTPAFENLIEVTRGVLKVIDWHKQNLVAHFVLTGKLSEFDRYIVTGPERAVQGAKIRRKRKASRAD